MADLAGLIDEAIIDDPPVSVRGDLIALVLIVKLTIIVVFD